jgi:AraC-like DNA-binding protein
MQIVQLNARLDRLSALLEGVAPVFSILDPTGLHGTGDLAELQSELSLAMVINPLGVGRHSDPSLFKPKRPTLWIGHLSQWAELRSNQGTGTQEQICIRAQLNGPLGPLLMEEFTQAIYLHADADEAALSASVTLIQQEVSHPRCGQPALLKSAGDILFIGILRHLVAHAKPERPGLLHALSDVRMAKPLVAMHQTPHLNWNLASLALESGMSRTSFATAFKKPWARHLASIWWRFDWHWPVGLWTMAKRSKKPPASQAIATPDQSPGHSSPLKVPSAPELQRT